MSFKSSIKKIALLATIVAIAAPMAYAPVADAKSFGGGRSFSSSSFSRSSSYSSRSSGSFWGSSKKSSSYSSAKTYTSSKPVQKKSTSVKPVSSAKSSKFGASKPKSFQHVGTGYQTASAKYSLKAQRAKFKKPAYTSTAGSKVNRSFAYKKTYSSNPVYASARHSNRSTYFDRRHRYYSSYHVPTYVYNVSPSYGLWDTIFLYSMLNNMSNASTFAYNHQHDADYMAWRREAERQAQTNADLRAELASLDSKISKMSGPVNPNYLPKGVDADIALSQEALASQKPTLRVCVGSKSGAYYRVTSLLQQGQNSVNVDIITTEGSLDTIDAIADGKCDGGFVQSNSYWNYVETKQSANLPFTRMFSPFKETVHLVCNARSGIKNVDDLDSDNHVYFPQKSGAASTWADFVADDSDYRDVQTSLTNPALKVGSTEEAFLKAGQDKNGCAMYVVAAGATSIMRNTDNGAKASNLVLVNVKEDGVTDTTDPSGAHVYSTTELNKKTYPNLLRKAGWFGLFSGNVNTLKVNADFIISDAWKDKNKDAYPEMANVFVGMTPTIHKTVHQ